jgi:hypothetical protein
MGCNFIEIPVERVEVHFKSSGRIINLEPEFIGPCSQGTVYADNKPYTIVNMVTILFKRVQDHSFLVNFSDWSIITEAIKKGDVIFRLILPDCFDDINLIPNAITFSKYIDMFEFNGTIKKEK